jgi:hypothetical protein
VESYSPKCFIEELRPQDAKAPGGSNLNLPPEATEIAPCEQKNEPEYEDQKQMNKQGHP